jgi:hypothetical protein
MLKVKSLDKKGWNAAISQFEAVIELVRFWICVKKMTYILGNASSRRNKLNRRLSRQKGLWNEPKGWKRLVEASSIIASENLPTAIKSVNVISFSIL